MGSDELVARLRDADRNSVQRMNGSRIFGEAADRIERLTAQLAEARESERAAVVALKRIADGEPVWLENGSKWASPMPAREAQRIAMEALPTGEPA